MPITSKNQLQIAYKKLVGKTNTNPLNSAAAEAFASSVQSFSSVIFGETPELNTDKVEEVVFDLVEINTSQYTVNNDLVSIEIAEEVAATAPHAFRLKFPADYPVDGHFYDQINPNFGSTFEAYVDQFLNIQIVPVTFGNDFAAHVYKDTALTEEIYSSGRQDWILDCFSGILFMQDVFDIPQKIKAYVYTGKYLDEMVEEAASSGGGATPAGDSGQIQFHNGQQDPADHHREVPRRTRGPHHRSHRRRRTGRHHRRGDSRQRAAGPTHAHCRAPN